MGENSPNLVTLLGPLTMGRFFRTFFPRKIKTPRTKTEIPHEKNRPQVKQAIFNLIKRIFGGQFF
jgi:Na+-transporting methylmalonyl-CoA/oxaloacetate decarboxylase gamma subunit